ncbi:MAG: hypothetical protein C0602_12440 [Denitrovibrio sp.]|nr:MAG: hypothetical protein C0602_12440 [Denitrovibrio sp.]
MNKIEYEIDYNNKIEIVYKTSKPIEIISFANSIRDISNSFQYHVSKELKQVNINSQLFIKEVRAGSVELDLVAYALPLLHIVYEHGILVNWATTLKTTIDFIKTCSKIPEFFDKREEKYIKNIVSPIAQDKSLQLFFNAYNGANVTYNFNINHDDASSIISKTPSIQEDNTENGYMYKQMLKWYQTKFDLKATTGDKAIVESISKKPKKIIFANETIKKSLTSRDDRFEKPWHELAYIVDLEIQFSDQEPILYKILDYYPEDTFDPAE